MIRHRLLLFLIVLGCTFGGTDYASASNICQSADASYTATATIPTGIYTVYARFGKVSQQGDATFISRDTTRECATSGTVTINGTSWTPIATLDAAGAAMTLELQSPLLTNLPDANRPLIMLISQKAPACSVDTECRVNIAGQPATIQSPDIADDHSALRVLVPKTLEDSHMTQVSYYADDTLMYTTSSLEAFDARMIPYYATRTSRMITYDNGQRATLSEVLPYTHPDGPSQFVYRLWRQHTDIFNGIAIALGILIIQQIIKLIIYAIYRDRRWRYAHGFLKDHLATLNNARERNIAKTKFIIQKTFAITEKILLYSLIVGIFVFSMLTFIVKFTRVDGESMSPALASGQLVYINMAPISIAHLNHSTYIPHRGDTIAARPLFGIVAPSKETEELIVKRVIGLPGERVVVKDNIISVYNNTHPDGFNPDTFAEHPYVTINDDASHYDIDITLANDELFVCGDNRIVSIDSRDNGSISISQIIGLVANLPLGLQ